MEQLREYVSSVSSTRRVVVVGWFVCIHLFFPKSGVQLRGIATELGCVPGSAECVIQKCIVDMQRFANCRQF